MPTGYTYAVKDGTMTDVKKFILSCARAFGAYVMMREEPSNAPEPKDLNEPSDYHKKALATAKNRLAKVTLWGLGDAQFEAEKEYRHAMEEYRQRLEQNEVVRKRYDDMLEQVKAWRPPTKDHQPLKQFMIDQLTESKKFDLYEPDEPKLADAVSYRLLQREMAERDIKYHAAEYDKEVERCNGRKEWIEQLKKSLGLEVTYGQQK